MQAFVLPRQEVAMRPIRLDTLSAGQLCELDELVWGFCCQALSSDAVPPPVSGSHGDHGPGTTIRGEPASGRDASRHTLVFGGSVPDRNHDAAMRIGGEAPGRRAHSVPRHRQPLSPSGHRHLGSSSTVRHGHGDGPRTRLSRSAPGRPLTPPDVARRPPASHRWSRGATTPRAASSPRPRSWSCACRRGRPPCAPGTSARGRCRAGT
jgi:hypothetical protein